MNLTNRRLLSISYAYLRFVCVDCSRMRLYATQCKWFNVFASQNGFMMQNLCKHIHNKHKLKLCLKELNVQDKPHFLFYSHSKNNSKK